MPRDSFGAYSLPNGTLVNAGDVIQPSQHNPAMSDLGSNITSSLSRDGLGGMRANLDMGAFNITNAGSVSATALSLSGALSVGDLTATGAILFGAAITTGQGISTGNTSIELGGARSADGASFIDLHGTSGSDYESRLARLGGANGTLTLTNKGTGTLTVMQEGAGAIAFGTSNSVRMTISTAGQVTLTDQLNWSLANFFITPTSGFPRVTWDANDYLEYDRGNNVWNFVIGSSVIFKVTASGITDGNNSPYGYKDVPQNPQGGSYALALVDRGACVQLFGVGADVLTIPSDGSVAWTDGTTIAFANTGNSTKTINPAGGVTLRLAGTSLTGARTLAPYAQGTLMRMTTNTWFVNGAGVS